MSSYSSLKATINANVKTNGTQAITGSVLNSVLNAMVDSIGADYQYMGVATPSTNPGTPDQKVFYIATTPGTYTNFGGIVVASGECAVLKGTGSTWSKEDTGIDLVSVSQNTLTTDNKAKAINVGGTDYNITDQDAQDNISQLNLKVDGKTIVNKNIIWSNGYIAGDTGVITYSSYSQFCQPILLRAGEKLSYKTGAVYSIAVVQVADDTPVQVGDILSGNVIITYPTEDVLVEYVAVEDIYIVICCLISSNEISFTAYNSSPINKQIVYDVSANNNGSAFVSLQALLNDPNLQTLIPSDVRTGGMSIRFMTSDNKYVQYRLMNNSFSTNVNDWQGVDENPIAGSENLVESGGVFNELSKICQGLIPNTENANPLTLYGLGLASDGSMVYNDIAKVIILNISTPKVGDTFVWGNGIDYLCFYKDDTLLNYFSAFDGSRTIIAPQNIVGANKIIAAFKILETPTLTLNGVDILYDIRLTTDKTLLKEKVPAEAKKVGELLYKYQYDGYIDANGDITYSVDWFYMEYILPRTLVEGDTLTWVGISNDTVKKLIVYDNQWNKTNDYSAYTEEHPTNTRNISIVANSASIGCKNIRASFFKANKSFACIYLNGIQITPLCESLIDRSIGLHLRSVANLNADKQPMITSLSRARNGHSAIKKYFTLAQISDTHNENELVERAVEFINDETMSSIDCLVHTGDIQFYQFNEGDVPLYHKAMDNSPKPAFTCLGNHDIYTSTTLEAVYNRFMKPMVDNGLLIAGINIDSENYATWYYKDFPDYKIRLIVLNDFDPMFDEYTKPLNTTSYSPEQITFLINTLNSTAADYTIIVAQHFPICKGEGYVGTIIDSDWTMAHQAGDLYGTLHGSVFDNNESPILDILYAYKAKTSIAKTYSFNNEVLQNHYGDISVSANFSAANGEMGFIICGHDHNDVIFKFANKGNIIAVGMLGGVNPTKIDSDAYIFREKYGKSWDAINVFTIRADERKVYVIRIGADFKATGQYQILTSFTY